MKLIKINGKIWELSKLWYESTVMLEKSIFTEEEKNRRAVQHGALDDRGSNRMLAKGVVKANGNAVIEIMVSGYPAQQPYDIYYGSKGYYCNVRGRRVYLEDLLPEDKE